MNKFCVLMTDDGARQLESLKQRLLGAGYAVTVAPAGAALEAAATARPGLTILSIRAPVPHNIELLKRLKQTVPAPVVVLNQEPADCARVILLRSGADDCLSWPFCADEVVARIEAIRRRLRPAQDDVAETLTWGNVIVEPQSHRLIVDGRPKYLPRLEWLLLMELTRNAGRPVPHEVLLSRVWGPEYRNDRPLLRMCISQLRDKLSAGGDGALITTVRRRGYIMGQPHRMPSCGCS